MSFIQKCTVIDNFIPEIVTELDDDFPLKPRESIDSLSPKTSLIADHAEGNVAESASFSFSSPTVAQSQMHRHAWMHFTPHPHTPAETPIIERGEGCYIYDAHGKKYIDGLASLFTTQIGHGRQELAQAALQQMQNLSYFPMWNFGNSPAAQLAERLAGLAPGNLNRVFFTNSGSESVETAWKLIKQYFSLIGMPQKYKVITRRLAYHGTTQGALSLTALSSIKQEFEPLVPGNLTVPNTNMYRPAVAGMDEESLGLWLANQVEAAIVDQGPDTVAAVFVEPMQNSGGCLGAPAGYYQRVREICDKYQVLLVSDETICGFGRLGEWFGCQKFGFRPDIITCAKGLTSGYLPMGAVIVDDAIFAPFASGEHFFKHGYTYGGHPVAAAVALANIDILENEKIIEHVRAHEPLFAESLYTLLDLPIVGDIRGTGYFWAIELVRDKITGKTFTDEECQRILKGFVSRELLARGLHCRADDRGEPVIMLAPPLVAGVEQFTEIINIIRPVLIEAGYLLN